MTLGLLCLLFFTRASEAGINMPAHFTDHMVLQQNSSVPIWGWSACSEVITICGSWNNIPVKSCSDNHAAWAAELQTPPAGGPYSIVIWGESDTLIIKDVLIGEVWLASGQSNMEWSLAQLDQAKQDIDEADYPSIRLFQVEKRSAVFPQQDVKGQWISCSPASVANFSAVAYFFARRLQEELNIPIGVIHSSWGGTGAEVWVNAEVIEGDQELMDASELVPEIAFGPRDPGACYNAMIAPLIPFRIAGTIWYQGESNRNNYFVYEKLFSTLIKDWRGAWKYDFPFYYVQIAPFNYSEPRLGLKIREAQFSCRSIPNTGMVLTSDIGDINLIHPPNKEGVGDRLANLALALTYHLDSIPYSGPVYKQMMAEKNSIRIYFDHADSGLVSKDGKLTHFQIAGEDQVFMDADASIEGSTVVVSSRRIKKPVAVRFAWSNIAEPNLFNTKGLPSSCFRTDNWDGK